VVQKSLLTDGAALDVEAGDAQHEVANGLGANGPWRVHRRRPWHQQAAAVGERHCAPAIGEQAEVADADEAVGDDVEQEAAEELVDVERGGRMELPRFGGR